MPWYEVLVWPIMVGTNLVIIFVLAAIILTAEPHPTTPTTIPDKTPSDRQRQTLMTVDTNQRGYNGGNQR